MRRRIAAREDPNAIYLIDCSIYIFRAWHQSKPSTFVDGIATNATIGFLAFIFQLLQRRQPRLIACAFDQRSAHSARKSLFPAYKANRSPPPAALQPQFAHCRRLLTTLGIHCSSHPRIEADDIIGMWAKAAQMTSVIVSADKDLCQFVGRTDALWEYACDRWFDYRAIENRFNVRPHQLADWLALTGDKVDNIPGVPGIGPATAARLLTKWGNLDNLLANIDKISQMKFRGAALAGERLRAHRQLALDNRRLTGLIEDSSINTNMSGMTIQPDYESAERQLGELVDHAQLKRWLTLLQTLEQTKTA